MTTDNKALLVREIPMRDELKALADKAINRAMWGHATELRPDDVRLLLRAAAELERLTETCDAR